jgi:hypothetical protein
MGRDRRRDLEIGLRKNLGKRLARDWLASLSEACGTVIADTSFLSLEKTEKLKTAFFARVKTESKDVSLCWRREDEDTPASHLRDLCADVRGLPVILFSSVDHLVGAARVPADLILRNAMSVWKVVEEDLSLTTEDLQHGLCLEANFYTPSGEYVRTGVYELTAWGAFRTPPGHAKD